MDLQVVAWFANHRVAPLDAIAQVLTVIGRVGLMFVVAAAVRGLMDRKLGMAAWQVVLAVLLALLMSDGVMKPAFNRERPFIADPTLQTVGHRPSSGSFPSGHAATCFAGALVLASTWPTARVGIWTAAAIVAVSRVYLGVHYPSDVLAGALVGLAVGWFVLGRTVWRVRSARVAA
jgi:undecaprenyl-diphosphatase